MTEKNPGMFPKLNESFDGVAFTQTDLYGSEMQTLMPIDTKRERERKCLKLRR